MIPSFTGEKTRRNRRRSRTFLLLLLVFLLHILSVSALCGEPGNKASPEEKPPLVVGYTRKIFYNVDINDARASTKVWAEMVIKKAAKFGKSDTVIFDDVSSMEKLVRANAVDLVVMRPEEFLAVRNKVALVPMFVPDFGKHFNSQYVLIVRTDSGIGNLSELRHKKLLRESGQSGDIPSLWLDATLMKQGLGGMKDFFTSIKVVNKAAQAILPVFFKQVDAALSERSSFDMMVELNPQIGKEIKVLAMSQGFVGAVLCLRKDFFDRFKDDISEALDSLHKDPQGRQLLLLFRANKLVSYTPEHLHPVEALLKEHLELQVRITKK